MGDPPGSVSQLRVCIVSQEYPPTGGYFGGIGTQYAALAPSWAAEGAEVHVVTALPPGKEVPAVIDRVNVHSLRRSRALPWVGAAWSLRIQAALRGLGRFDVIISPEFRGEADG